MDERTADRPAAARPGRRRRKMQRVTMVEVAALAAVSPSTVSLYLRKPAAVSPAAGRAIAHAIDSLGYRPNLVAGGLAAASSRVVGVVVPSIRNAFFADTVAALQSGLAAAGLQLLLGHTEYSEQEEEALVRTALSWAPAAVVLTGLGHSAATRRLLRASGLPVVEIWELGGEPIDMAVGFSHAAVGRTAAAHLLAKGRRRLAFLGARLQDDRRARQRAEGFQAAARAAGATVDLVANPAPASAEVGGLLLDQLLRQSSNGGPEVDAVACSNDHVALGVLFECQRRGLAVPERLAVIGFGDLDYSAWSNPPLTTIRPSGALIGAEAARLIAARVASAEAAGPAVIDTHHVLVERRST